MEYGPIRVKSQAEKRKKLVRILFYPERKKQRKLPKEKQKQEKQKIIGIAGEGEGTMDSLTIEAYLSITMIVCKNAKKRSPKNLFLVKIYFWYIFCILVK